MFKERFIVAPGVNGTELMRSLSSLGRSMLAERIVAPVELASIALERQGFFFDELLLTSAQAETVFFAEMPPTEYFREDSLPDAQAVFPSLNELRAMFAQNEAQGMEAVLNAGLFPEKNKALYAIYHDYIGACETGRYLDGIMLMRRAIELCKPIDADWAFLSEAPLTPLEQRLVEALSGGKAKRLSVPELLPRTEPAPRAADAEVPIVAAYGASNEVEHILADILKSKRPFDKCVVAVTDVARYAQLFFDFAQLFSLPVTFGCGVPILNANPAKLLKLLHGWETADFGAKALSSVFFSEAFDRARFLKTAGETKLSEALKLAGDLRLGMDAAENREKTERLRAYCAHNGREEELALLAWLDRAFSEFEKGYLHIVSEYAYMPSRDSHQNKLDRAAQNVIAQTLRAFSYWKLEKSIPEAIPSLLNKTVASENSREGYLHVTNIEGARFTLRERLYIAGMSAALFPGNPRENPVFLDEDYLPLLHSVEKARLPLSDNRVAAKLQAFRELCGIHAARRGELSVSYASFDLAELKAENPSSALFEMYRGMKPDADFADFERSVQPKGFFEAALSDAHIAGRNHLSGALMPRREDDEETFSAISLERPLSPSALERFFTCPRLFKLSALLGVRFEEEDDPFTWMSPAQQGNFAHALMEKAAGADKAAFLNEVDTLLAYWECRRPPLSDARRQKDAFREMLLYARESDPGNEVVTAEQSYSARHPSGIVLFGRPDRIERGHDGRHIVVDYKTAARVSHTPNDTLSCLQTLLYAYMLEQNGIGIERCEYRYLRAKQTVVCAFDETRRKELDALLEEVAAALKSGVFPKAETEEPCQYCPYKPLCGGVA